MKPLRLTVLVTAVAALGVALVGCGQDESSSGSDGTRPATVTVSDAWVRSVQGQGAAYFTITGGTSADALTKVAVPASVAKEAQLHETMVAMGGGKDGSSTTMAMGGGAMEMKPVPQIDVPAGATVQLKPGGFHVMLVDVVKPLAAGDTVPLTLTFEKAGTRTVTAKVRAL